jgi:hypothetical protein
MIDLVAAMQRHCYKLADLGPVSWALMEDSDSDHIEA